MASIRLTEREKPRSLAPQDVAFRHLRHQLREAGWKSRCPKGLENDWTYLKPGASANAAVGIDIFVGEVAVVAYCIDSGLLKADNEASDVVRLAEHDAVTRADGSTQADAIEDQAEHKTEDQDEGRLHVQCGEDGGDAESIVRPPQIDTIVHLSQTTLEVIFAFPTPSEVELSQGIFGFGCSHCHTHCPRHEFKPDVTFVDGDENPRDYEQLSSGESDGGALEDNEEDLVGRRHLDGDDDVISHTDAVQMDEPFLNSLCIGADKQLRKESLKRRQETLRKMRWTSSDFESLDPYPGLIADEAWPDVDLRDLYHSPIETFFYFAPKSLRVDICKETNRYNSQQIILSQELSQYVLSGQNDEAPQRKH
ncbi:hypothetical protein ON010_g1026 [Phytophthora cinnamomi]|nr:hypothetical protein ON010_g1026 [Phytophthora cinnamomi]